MHSFLNSNANGSDGINSIIIKNNAFLIAPQLEYIINLSFTTDVFLKLLKVVFVTPIYKFIDNTDPGNYRPISIVTIFSKLIEKV